MMFDPPAASSILPPVAFTDELVVSDEGKVTFPPPRDVVAPLYERAPARVRLPEPALVKLLEPPIAVEYVKELGESTLIPIPAFPFIVAEAKRLFRPVSSNCPDPPADPPSAPLVLTTIEPVPGTDAG